MKGTPTEDVTPVQLQYTGLIAENLFVVLDTHDKQWVLVSVPENQSLKAVCTKVLKGQSVMLTDFDIKSMTRRFLHFLHSLALLQLDHYGVCFAFRICVNHS